MSFAKIPDRMVGYATFELAELLAALTQDQRHAIDRIVQHVYLDNRPWALLFRDQAAIPPSREYPQGRPAIERICAETSYYRRGSINPTTGKQTRAGWGHDEPFQNALKKAVELALATHERERSQRLQAAKRKAEENAEAAVDAWVEVMENSRVDFARIEAAGKVLELAFRGEGDGATQSSGRAAEFDWWAAADGGQE